MEKQELLKNLDELMQIVNRDATSEQGINAVETVQNLLEEYLKEHPQDSEIWFKLALIFFFDEDIPSSIECMGKILSYDPNNAYAFLLFVWFHDYWPFIHDALFERLSAFSVENKKIMSMIEYLKYKYYFTHSNKKMQEQSLKKSIDFCDEYVWNYHRLAQLYIYEGRSDEAYPLVIKALANVKRVSDSEYEFHDFLDLDTHINGFLTGTWINNIQYVHIVSLLDSFYVTKDFSKSSVH